MKLLLEVNDSKAALIMELLKNVKGVRAIPLKNYKSNVLKGVKVSVEEVKQIRQGNLKRIPARELLNEL